MLHLRDISERIKYQQNIVVINKELDLKVKERTKELELLNNNLQKEISCRIAAQESTKKQTTFLQLVIDLNPNMVFVKDKIGIILLVNEAFAMFYNTTKDDIIGNNRSVFSIGDGNV